MVNRGLVNTNFSALSQFVNPADRAGKFFNDYSNRLREEERTATLDKRYADEQAYRQDRDALTDERNKVLDDRAATLFDEGQAEKQMLKYASQVSAVAPETEQARRAQILTDQYNAQNPNAPKQINEFWDAAGKIKTAGQPVDIGVAQPRGYNVGLSSTSTTPVSPSVPVQQTVSAGIPTEVPIGISTPTVQTKAPVKVQPVDNTNLLANTVVGALRGDTPLNPAALSTAVRSALNYVNTNAIKPLYTQIRSSIYGGGTDVPQDRVLTENELNPTAPQVQQVPTAVASKTELTPTEKKVEKILKPETKSEQKQAVKTVTSALDQLQTGKVTQVSSAVIDKIYDNIDPNAQSRSEGTALMNSMLFSLGMSPKQVKEYTEPTMDAMYGKAGDPISIARAQANAAGYGKNVDSANKRQETILKNQMDMHIEGMRAAKEKGLPPGYTIWTNPKTGQQEAVLLSSLQNATNQQIKSESEEGKIGIQKQVNDLYTQYRKNFKEDNSGWFSDKPMSFQEWQKAGRPAI